MVLRRDLYYELILLQKKLSNTLLDGKHKQDILDRINEVSNKIELENQHIHLDVNETSLIEFRQQIINKYPDLEDIFLLFWFTFSPFLDVDETLTYNGFEKFSSLLQNSLLGNKNDNDNKRIAKLDHGFYTRIYGNIDKVAFFDILFRTLVDWTDKDDILHYTCFMWTLLTNIADLNWNPPKLRSKREIRHILKDNEMKMFSAYFEGKAIREASLKHYEYWKSVDTKAKLRVATRRVGSNLNEKQIQAIVDIYYSKVTISSGDNDGLADSDDDNNDNDSKDNNDSKKDTFLNDTNNDTTDTNININNNNDSKKKKLNFEYEYYERLKNVKRKVNSWNNRKLNVYTWDPEDRVMIDAIYEDRGFALKYFENDDYIEEQMEAANVRSINILRKFNKDFKARETMYLKKYVAREREVKQKVIVPSKPKSKPRVTPQMVRAKEMVKERGIGAFMAATKSGASKASKKSWETLAKIMENRNKRRFKRESMIMQKNVTTPPTLTLEEIKEEEDENEQLEELEELLNQQLREEDEIEKTIGKLSSEELQQLQLEAKLNEEKNIEEHDIDGELLEESNIMSEEEALAYVKNNLDSPDDMTDNMTDNITDLDSYYSYHTFSPSRVLKKNWSNHLKPISQSAFLVLRSSPAPETNLKMKVELENRKVIRKGKDPLFPRSFITNTGEFLTADNCRYYPKQKFKEEIASKFQAKKSLNDAIKKSKESIHNQIIRDIRHIKEDIESTKKIQEMKNEKRFDQIKRYKQFRRQMLAYLKETKNVKATDCMRFMNEKMVSIIIQRYNNIDPDILMNELFETVEQSDRFHSNSSNNRADRTSSLIPPCRSLSGETAVFIDEDLKILNENDQSFENISEVSGLVLDTDNYDNYDNNDNDDNNSPSSYKSIEVITTKQLLRGKFSPLAVSRSIHPDQETFNRKNWNASNPGWYTLGSGFRSQSPMSPSSPTNSPSNSKATSRSPSPTRIKGTVTSPNKLFFENESKMLPYENFIPNDESQMSEGIMMNALIKSIETSYDNIDDLSIDDSVKSEEKDSIKSPTIEFPKVRNVYTPESPGDMLIIKYGNNNNNKLLELQSRQNTPARPSDELYALYSDASLNQLTRPTSPGDGEQSNDSISVNTTNLIISQNKKSMRLQPITPPAIFNEIRSYSPGISPSLFDNEKHFERRIIQKSSSTINIRKTTKYNQLKLFPSKSNSLERSDDNIKNEDINDEMSINKDKIINKLNQLKLKEPGNALHPTKSKTIEGRYRSGTSVTPKRELLNILAGRDKNIRPFCGM